MVSPDTLATTTLGCNRVDNKHSEAHQQNFPVGWNFSTVWRTVFDSKKIPQRVVDFLQQCSKHYYWWMRAFRAAIAEGCKVKVPEEPTAQMTNKTCFARHSCSILIWWPYLTWPWPYSLLSKRTSIFEELFIVEPAQVSIILTLKDKNCTHLSDCIKLHVCKKKTL